MVLVVFQKLFCNDIFTVNCISQKTQNFTLISNPLKKCLKMCQKKLLAKTSRKYALFTLVRMFVKLVLLMTFVLHFLKTFLTNYSDIRVRPVMLSWNF